MSLKRSWKPRATSVLGPLSLVLGSIAVLGAAPRGAEVQILLPRGGLPPNLVGQLRGPRAFVQTAAGGYIVFDQRAQQVYGVDPARTTLTKLVEIGPSDGQILNPGGFAYSRNRTFTIIDAPGQYERVQAFYEDGTPLSRFQRWPKPGGAVRANVSGVVFGGLSAIAPIGRNFLADADTGTDLMHEIDPDGHVVRAIGMRRATGQSNDAELHRALNNGIPLIAPDGSIYFVFTNGEPLFRKYSAAGRLLFERHIEGPELDNILQNLPTTWRRERVQGAEFPIVTSTVTAAAIDPHGDVWISLGVPYTYVYDAVGNKTRTVQFRGTELMTPTSFFFTTGGRLLVTPGCYEFVPY